MAHRYVKKKNGKWNVFSTVIDDYLYEVDLTLDELEKEEIKEETEIVNAKFYLLRSGSNKIPLMSEEETEEIINFRAK